MNHRDTEYTEKEEVLLFLTTDDTDAHGWEREPWWVGWLLRKGPGIRCPQPKGDSHREESAGGGKNTKAWEEVRGYLRPDRVAWMRVCGCISVSSGGLFDVGVQVCLHRLRSGLF